MITEESFDFFLKNGFIDGLPPNTELTNIIERYGDNCWTVKEVENNGLIYGIIMIGMMEIHIYNERLNGISIKLYAFDESDYPTKTDIPWISKHFKLGEIIKELDTRDIEFKKYSVIGPKDKFKTSGASLYSLEKGKHVFLDTKGGVTFLFDSLVDSPEIEAYQICKYYKN